MKLILYEEEKIDLQLIILNYLCTVNFWLFLGTSEPNLRVKCVCISK